MSTGRVIPKENGTSANHFGNQRANAQFLDAEPQYKLIDSQADQANQEHQKNFMMFLRKADAALEDKTNRQEVVEQRCCSETDKGAPKPRDMIQLGQEREYQKVERGGGPTYKKIADEFHRKTLYFTMQ